MNQQNYKSAFYPGTTRYGGSSAVAKRREAARKAFFKVEGGTSRNGAPRPDPVDTNVIHSYIIDPTNIVRIEPTMPHLTSSARRIFSWIEENSAQQDNISSMLLTKRPARSKLRFNPMSYHAPVLKTSERSEKIMRPLIPQAAEATQTNKSLIPLPKGPAPVLPTEPIQAAKFKQPRECKPSGLVDSVPVMKKSFALPRDPKSSQAPVAQIASLEPSNKMDPKPKVQEATIPLSVPVPAVATSLPAPVATSSPVAVSEPEPPIAATMVQPSKLTPVIAVAPPLPQLQPRPQPAITEAVLTPKPIPSTVTTSSASKPATMTTVAASVKAAETATTLASQTSTPAKSFATPPTPAFSFSATPAFSFSTTPSKVTFGQTAQAEATAEITTIKKSLIPTPIESLPTDEKSEKILRPLIPQAAGATQTNKSLIPLPKGPAPVLPTEPIQAAKFKQPRECKPSGLVDSVPVMKKSFALPRDTKALQVAQPVIFGSTEKQIKIDPESKVHETLAPSTTSALAQTEATSAPEPVPAQPTAVKAAPIPAVVTTSPTPTTATTVTTVTAPSTATTVTAPSTATTTTSAISTTAVTTTLAAQPSSPAKSFATPPTPAFSFSATPAFSFSTTPSKVTFGQTTQAEVTAEIAPINKSPTPKESAPADEKSEKETTSLIPQTAKTANLTTEKVSPVLDFEMDTMDVDVPNDVTPVSAAAPSAATSEPVGSITPVTPVNPFTPVNSSILTPTTLNTSVSQPLFVPPPSFTVPTFTSVASPSGSNPFQPVSSSVRGRKILRPTRRLHR